ncbi:unnamed protein product [Caenorhabditis bovis]|uniref:C6 domain-containing protein n=1 Tax=Caenorhabditis bovis TaxID=2654633 RepID=A0A8S1E6Z9_9PELO|nr:unnamed protein product [Caenorhabditis bovis]
MQKIKIFLNGQQKDLPWKTCNDCSHINVQLFDGNPFEDASSVLNRYSASGCYYVQFFCRPIEFGDPTPVSTILSGNTSDLSAPLNLSLACRDKKWILLGSAKKTAVTSLSCVYSKPATKTPKPNPEAPCMKCTNVVVGQSRFPEGVAYLDHTLDKCLRVVVHCTPVNDGKEVEMMYNLQRTYNGGPEVNRTFTCNKNSKWVDVETKTIINNISCIMPKETLKTTTFRTTEIVDSTVSNLPSTDIGPISSVNPTLEPEPISTTPDKKPPEDNETTDHGGSTIIDGTTGDPTMTPIDVQTTVGSCDTCADLEPEAISKAGTYNGMLVLWHYRDPITFCKRVDISCQATMHESDNATLVFNPIGNVESNVAEITKDIQCSGGSYFWNDEPIDTVSCIASVTSLVPITTPSPATTPAPPSGCSSCRRIPVPVLDHSSGYLNGQLKAVTRYSSCMHLDLVCHGMSEQDPVALIYEGAEIATGVGSVSMTLDCSATSVWMTPGQQTIDKISCGYQSIALISTTLSSECGTCEDMQSAKALLQDQTYDGMIVLYNYNDGCKKVDISCQGTTATENATLLFHPIGVISTGPTLHEMTISCSADGTWRYENEVIESVSCLVSEPTGPVVTVPVISTTTTMNPSLPLCAQCGRLNVGPISTIDDSMLNGVSTIAFSTVNKCRHATVTCSGEDDSEGVTLFAASSSLISGKGSISFNFICNSASHWMTNAGTSISEVMCGRWRETTTTTSKPSQCSICENLRATSMQPNDNSAYDGMIILNHYQVSTGCRRVDISCGPTLPTENATVFFGSAVVATGPQEHTFTIDCNSNGNWIYQGSAIASVSCLISETTNGVTVAPTTPTTTTIADPSVPACSRCGRAPIVSIGSIGTYMNGFTTVVQSVDENDCSVITIKCEGTTTGNGVALLSSGLPIASGFGSTTTELICGVDSTWRSVKQPDHVITALACGHKNAPVTPIPTTTIATNGLCNSCPLMTALAMSDGTTNYDGMVIMDHFTDPIKNCRKVIVTCGPTTIGERATLLLDKNQISSGTSAQVQELDCNENGNWITSSLASVTTASCLIEKTTEDDDPITATTVIPVTNPTKSLCTQCARLPVTPGPGIYRNGFVVISNTYHTYGCLVVRFTCEGYEKSELTSIVADESNHLDMSTGSSSVNLTCNTQGKWVYGPYGEINSISCLTSEPKTDIPVTSKCSKCDNIRPVARGSDESAQYDGMLVLTHYTSRDSGCKKAILTCEATMDNEKADLWIDSETADINDERQEFSLECSPNGRWNYNSKEISTASCLITNATTTGRKRRKKRQAGTGASACQSCPTFPMTSLRSFYPYMNGFVTLSLDDSGECIQASGMCEGISDNNIAAWILSGDVIASSPGRINMSFYCNSQSKWESTAGHSISQISCGRQVATTTAVATTTTSSRAMQCPNMIASPFSETELTDGQKNGQLILDHRVELDDMVRQVTITCYGSMTSDKVTISLNGKSQTVDGTGQITILLECSPTGEWLRDGLSITTASCIVTSGTGVSEPLTTPPPISTTIGTIPNTNCNRQLISIVPSGYLPAYLSMNTISTSTSLTVDMVCYSTTNGEAAKLIFDDGSELSAGAGLTNLSISCNGNAQWVVTALTGTGISIGKIISTVSCAVPAPITTTLGPVTANPACRACENLPGVPLESSQLASNERNGQFILDHYTDERASCRVLYLTCVGSGSIIIFNGATETSSGNGITTAFLTCNAQSNWNWNNQIVAQASCKVNDGSMLITTPVPSITTESPLNSENTLKCNRDSLKRPILNGDQGAYLVLDTIVQNGVLITTLSCSGSTPGTATLTNGDGTILGQSSSLLNATLTCNANSQWQLLSISGSETSVSPSGTIVENLSCGAISATTTTTTLATTTTDNDRCKRCENMKAFALTSAQLQANEKNGELLLDHYVEPTTKCRVVVIKCRGENVKQNATIYLNDDSLTLSAQYGQMSTSMSCSSSNVWNRNGIAVSSVACKISTDNSATSAAPITTQAPVATTPSSSVPDASCNREFVRATTSGYDSGFMTLDTVVSGGSMTVTASCAAPQTSQTAALVDSAGTRLSSAVGTTNLTLTCNTNSQWVTTDGTIVTTLSCGAIPLPTEAPVVDCSQAAWAEWQEWSDCTDTCGSCGTHQRFRVCNKPRDDCTCPGSVYEKTSCNTAVCKYPRVSCCDGFTPRSAAGTFCISGCLSIGGCGGCFLGLCLGAPMMPPLGCPCGAGFMCMRGGCVARAAGARTFRDVDTSHDAETVKSPDDHFKSCCSILDVQPTCMGICNYGDYSVDAIQSSIMLQSKCPPSDISKVHFCAARGTNHTTCCRQMRVPSDCDTFCDQGQDNSEVQLSINHLQCMNYFDDIKGCFYEHALNEYYEQKRSNADKKSISYQMSFLK